MFVDHDVIEMFRRGMAPSAIDAELRLRRGTAHDVVVEWWAERRRDGAE